MMKFQRKQLNQKNRVHGTTLVEMMIAVGIIGVLATVGPPLFKNTFKMWKLTESRVVVQQQARTTLNLVEGLLRQASAQTLVVSRHSLTEPPYSKIQFSLPNGREFHFYQQGNELWFYHSDAAAGVTHRRRIAEHLRYVSFGFPQIDVETLMSVAICFERGTYGGQKKQFYLSTQRIKVMNS